jgi:hypothetical protein
MTGQGRIAIKRIEARDAMVFMERLLNREFERPDISTSVPAPAMIISDAVEGSGKPYCYAACEEWSHHYDPEA